MVLSVLRLFSNFTLPFCLFQLFRPIHRLNILRVRKHFWQKPVETELSSTRFCFLHKRENSALATLTVAIQPGGAETAKRTERRFPAAPFALRSFFLAVLSAERFLRLLLVFILVGVRRDREQLVVDAGRQTIAGEEGVELFLVAVAGLRVDEPQQELSLVAAERFVERVIGRPCLALQLRRPLRGDVEAPLQRRHVLPAHIDMKQ